MIIVYLFILLKVDKKAMIRNLYNRSRHQLTNQVERSIWNQYFKDWLVILKIFVCKETIVKSVPVLEDTKDSVGQLSRNFFYRIHVRKFQLKNPRG